MLSKFLSEKKIAKLRILSELCITNRRPLKRSVITHTDEVFLKDTDEAQTILQVQLYMCGSREVTFVTFLCQYPSCDG